MEIWVACLLIFGMDVIRASFFTTPVTRKPVLFWRDRPLPNLTQYYGECDNFYYAQPIVDKFLRHTEQWVIAAAGSSGTPPPARCVRLLVTDTGRTCDCMYNTLNHTKREFRIFRIVGLNEWNITKIRTVGPMISFEEHEIRKTNLYRLEAIMSVVCWDRKTHKLSDWNYVLMNMVADTVNITEQTLYLIGIEPRYPHPHIEVAIITCNIKPISYVKNKCGIYNRAGWRYGMEYDVILPSMLTMCGVEGDEVEIKKEDQVCNIEPFIPKTKPNAYNPYKQQPHCSKPTG